MKTTILSAVAIFGSAFLIFLVQPMVGKRILPWFGGGPGVWTLCLMFYQGALFLGYAYAHGLIRLVPPRAQLVVHGLAFAGALLLLPVLPGDHWRPGGLDDPDGSIVRILLANVALPFMVLAATGPLVQAWFARLEPNRSPYPLYAVSNVGSLLALCAYPFLIEPRLGLSATSTLWGVGFAGCAVAVLACGFLARTSSAVESTSEESARSDISTPLAGALWLLLPASAVILLMAITNRLCLDLASVPFLWVLPLAIYLLSFVLCFASERLYRRTPFVLIMLLAFLLQVAGPFLGAISTSLSTTMNSIYGQIGLNCLLLLGVCMVMHGELYRLRPAPRNLTAFYLFVSGGGALGGLFVGVVAPRVFDRYHEFPIGLACTGVLLLVACGLDKRSALSFAGPRWRWLLAAPAAAAALLLVALGAAGDLPEVTHTERNFFGILRVLEHDMGDPKLARRALTHGNTLHGIQFQRPETRQIPTNYYGRAAGIGIALSSRAPGEWTHVGVVGLGAGTLAAYGRPGDRFRFYELDPDVIRLAQDESFFSFLAGSAAEIAVVPGDARLSLGAEVATGGQEFDLLVLDAFSSDAIPVHLLTVEAFELYLSHLRKGGVIAAHLSNRHLMLAPLVMRLGQRFKLRSMLVVNRDLPQLRTKASRWMLLSRDGDRLMAIRKHGLEYQQSSGLAPNAIRFQSLQREVIERTSLWTDDYSDLFGVLKPLRAMGPPQPK